MVRNIAHLMNSGYALCFQIASKQDINKEALLFHSILLIFSHN